MQAGDAGNYSVVITNAIGSVTSSNALLSVVSSQPLYTLENIWKIQAGSRNYVTTGNTERGIAINPKRQDLLQAVKGKGLPIRPIEEIKAEVEKICGGAPAKPRLLDNPVAVVKWVDGTVLDTVWQVADANP